MVLDIILVTIETRESFTREILNFPAISASFGGIEPVTEEIDRFRHQEITKAAQTDSLYYWRRRVSNPRPAEHNCNIYVRSSIHLF